MNKHELKSLLENIYYTLTEADIPDNPPAPEGWDQNSDTPWPWPQNPTSPVAPTERPIDVVGPIPPMPLDNNGNPLFPSQQIWELYYQLYRRALEEELRRGQGAEGVGPAREIFDALREYIYQWRLKQALQRRRVNPNQAPPPPIWG